MKKTISLLLLSFMFSCSDTTDQEDDIITPDEETIRYEVTFQGTWSDASHPNTHPSNSHFSGVIGMSHNGAAYLPTEDDLASEGLKVMAETGGKSPLISEINALIDTKSAETLISEGGLGSGSSSISFTLEVTNNNPYITFYSMIAPSPDWYVAVENLNLYQNDIWVDSLTIIPTHYDAGTDSGTTFDAPNSPTTPQQKIYPLSSISLGNEEAAITPLALFTFRKIEE
ncbi:spondin domain-containing protein [Flammeovirga sp. SubArs3]|uniref:spondin domain-containing protein n=1 Tax=Flammeovirga sp. SubArs3 TaxID=2995316 RepID=UPI00248B3B6E|nr:spondin domain-containing protein [Flammeovirga sp. SubArs3]